VGLIILYVEFAVDWNSIAEHWPDTLE